MTADSAEDCVVNNGEISWEASGYYLMMEEGDVVLTRMCK
jgi:hypothetical protein